MDVIDFSDYLLGKYLDWQKKTGKRKSIRQFADYLGVQHPLVSMWMSGPKKPSRESLEKISEVLGPEVFDIAGIERSDPVLVAIKLNWDTIPEEAKYRISEIMAEYKVGRKDIGR